jgi:hypothetical protein
MFQRHTTNVLDPQRLSDVAAGAFVKPR